MNKFLFKSNDSDLQKLIQLIDVRLDIHGKNILYITHVCDKILKKLNDSSLQEQVDKYFDEDTEHIPEVDKT